MLAAAVKEGLSCRFVIEERVPDSYRLDASGNNFLFRLLGVESVTVVPADTDIVAAMKKVADALGYRQPKYSVPNAKMVEAVQALARTEAILLDPVYTGKVMAGLIGLTRQGRFRAGERVLFLHTGGMPSLHAYEAELLGSAPVAD